MTDEILGDDELGHVEAEHAPPPSVDELPEVEQGTADALTAKLGDVAAQSADHPYDPDGDPDARPRTEASLTLDGDLPGAAPRAGG